MRDADSAWLRSPPPSKSGGISHSDICSDELLDAALALLNISDPERRSEAHDAVLNIVAMHRLALGVSIPRASKQRAIERADSRRILRAALSLRRELRRVDEGTFIELAGHTDAPLKTWDYDHLVRMLEELGRATAGLARRKAIRDLGGRPKGKPDIEYLAVPAWGLFNNYRPDQASSDANNDFVEFVTLIGEISTGARKTYLRQIKYVLPMLTKSSDELDEIAARKAEKCGGQRQMKRRRHETVVESLK